MGDTALSQVDYRSMTQVHLCAEESLRIAKGTALQWLVCRVRKPLEVLSVAASELVLYAEGM